MKPRLLSNAWIFVSHSSKDIRKVRLIRNYLERAGANPLIFRLKYLDDRPVALPTLLRAEIRARQFFLLCKSKNSLKSRWVKEEIDQVNKFTNKHKHVIDLDGTGWITPRAELDGLLRQAFITFHFAWTDRKRVRSVIDTIKVSGVEDDGRYKALAVGHEAALPGEEPELNEPLTLDHGIRGFDDRPGKLSTSWVEAAFGSAAFADTMVICTSETFQHDPFREENAEHLAEIAKHYSHRHVIDLDERWVNSDQPPWLRGLGWETFDGPLSIQLAHFVRTLKLRVRDLAY